MNKETIDLHESIFSALLVSFFNYHQHLQDPGKSLERYRKAVFTHEDNLRITKESADLYANNLPFRQCVDVTFAMILRRLSFYQISEVMGTPEARKAKH